MFFFSHRKDLTQENAFAKYSQEENNWYEINFKS